MWLLKLRVQYFIAAAGSLETSFSHGEAPHQAIPHWFNTNTVHHTYFVSSQLPFLHHTGSLSHTATACDFQHSSVSVALRDPISPAPIIDPPHTATSHSDRALPFVSTSSSLRYHSPPTHSNLTTQPGSSTLFHIPPPPCET